MKPAVTQVIVRARREQDYGMPEEGPFFGPFPDADSAREFAEARIAEHVWTDYRLHDLVTHVEMPVAHEIRRLRDAGK